MPTQHSRWCGNMAISKQLRRFRAIAAEPCTFSGKLFANRGVHRAAAWEYPNNFADFEHRFRRRTRFRQSCLKIAGSCGMTERRILRDGRKLCHGRAEGVLVQKAHSLGLAHHLELQHCLVERDAKHAEHEVEDHDVENRIVRYSQIREDDDERE